MKILVTGDLHYALKQFDWLLQVADDFDLVCIVGDLLDVASAVPIKAQAVVVGTYLSKLGQKSQVVVCSGNHDLMQPGNRAEREADWLRDLPHMGTAGDGTCLDIGTTRISAFPWWDGPDTRNGIRTQIARDAVGSFATWIWLYHAPPSESPTAWGGHRYFGDTTVREWIETYQPDFVLSGHVHQAPFVREGGWADRLGKSWIFNMGQQPGASPSHIILNTHAREALWFSIEGAEMLDLDQSAALPRPLTTLPRWLKAEDHPA
ncbi:MAG: metallophosphoesterase [Pseudomonadota bacterium]